MRTRINLTAKQVQRLQPFIDRVSSAAALGSPGMLVAQINWDTRESRFWITPAFFEHDLAKAVSDRVHAALAKGNEG